MNQKLTLLLIILLLATPVVAQDQHPKDTLVIAVSSDFEPFTFLNVEGQPAGMVVDIWRLWAQKTGKQVEFIASSWEISLENLKIQRADIHSGFLYSPEHFEWISGSQPLYEAAVSLFYPLKQGKISDIKELSGQTLAVIHGSQLEQFLIKNYPDIRVLPCDTREELVKVSRDGKTKGFIAISQVGTAVIDRMGVSGEFETNDTILYREKFHAGVLKGNTELLALVDKGFNAISSQELSEIETRWIPDPTKRYFDKPSNILQLSPEEEVWLRNHKTIKVGMSPVVPPLKFLENGIIKGIEPDYLNLLSEYTGIQFEYVISDFSTMDAKVKSGEIDMFLSFYIPERLAYMTFTNPLMDVKQVIIARTDAPFMSGIGALKGKKVATVKGVKLYEKILNPYPDIGVLQVATSDEMFKAVAEFKADALISRTYVVGYVMQNYPNLKVAGIADLPPDPYLYAIRKDYPELVALLNKAIAAIPRDTHDALVQKWFNVQIEYHPNWSEILKWALAIGGVFTFLLGLSLFWNRRLTQEIDRRKRAVEQQLKTTERLSLACHAGGIGIWELDLVENHLIWDDQMIHLYGITPDTFSGTYEAWRAGVHPEDLQKSEEELQMAIRGQKNFDTEFRVVRPDGTIHTIRALASVQRNSSGHAIKLIGTNYDITKRKKAEVERLRLLHILEASLNEIYVFDPVSLVFEYVNRCALRNLGYTIEAMREMTPVDLKPEFTEIAFRQAIGPLLRNEQEQLLFETVHRRRDGSLYPVEVHLQLVQLEGQRVFLAVIQDITERRKAEVENAKLEAQLQQAQKMESVGRLAGGVAHDFNNMLSVILGYAQMALDKTDPASSLYSDLQEIHSAGVRSANITRQLLAFARKQTIAPVVLDLNETVERMLKMLRRLIGEDINLTWQPMSVWPVKIDPAQLDQLLANICVNARDSISGVGKITIETETTTFDAAYCSEHAGFTPGEFVLLSISDDGCGMDKEILGNLFEPFFTTKEQGKGTGLGLSTVYGIVKQNNGFINVYSEPGKGTTFRIYLPRHSQQSGTAEKRSEGAIQRGQGETVLVVEDELAILKLTARMLENLGYTVVTTNNPTEAVTLAKERREAIDLLITDVIMPKMNGRDLADALLAIYPDLKCLFMSGYTASVIASQGVLEAGVHFIQKPFSARDLAAKMREALA